MQGTSFRPSESLPSVYRRAERYSRYVTHTHNLLLLGKLGEDTNHLEITICGLTFK